MKKAYQYCWNLANYQKILVPKPESLIFFDLAGYGSLEETLSCQYVSCFLQGLPFLDTAVVGKTSKPAYSKSERRVLHTVSC